jgi:hypothetical protein
VYIYMPICRLHLFIHPINSHHRLFRTHSITLSLPSIFNHPKHTQPTTKMQFKITDLLLLSLATLAAADCDGDDCSATSTAVASTSIDVNGAVITNVVSSTDVIRSSSLVPVLTQDVDTTTDVDVNTNRQTLSQTTDVGTTPTNTLVQVATTTDIGLESGYAYTTNSAGSSIATYTGDDESAPRTSSVQQGAATTSTATTTTATEDSFAVATAVPYLGAAAMAGLAFMV